ncbi:MAG TPA: pyridoxamine 5'-phosphate oxidase [Candidatus Acidoferrum sp.]|nr:pyridoxamine 5'-phosphate oxidase [Candidatus Acidoferrum sp.]
MNLEQFRRDYLQGGLRRGELPDDPLQLFTTWQQQAIASGLVDPTAMVLATVNAEGQPSQRFVLLKSFDARGFVFYTNYGSRKAADIAGNSRVSLLFPWHMLERQVKVEGRAEKVSLLESAKYFATRPRESQLAAWASSQSHALGSRQLLLAQLDAMRHKFANGEVPLPDFWGGFRVVPSAFEFWQGGGNRLHDRFHYARHGDAWGIERLAP